MSLSDLASLGSFISGFAVLVSLIFLYFQLRQVNAQVAQTERNQRALMNQGIINRGSEDISFLAQPHILEVTSRVLAGDTKFTPIELNQLRLVMRKIVIGAQDAYVQSRAGLTDQAIFDNALRALKFFMGQPVYRALWRANRDYLADEFVSVVDRLIETLPLTKPLDQIGRYESELAEVLR